MTLYCWSLFEEQLGDCEIPYPLGTVVSNPNHERALSITLTFTKYLGSTTIVFPGKEIIFVSCPRIHKEDMVSSKVLNIFNKVLLDLTELILVWLTLISMYILITFVKM